MFQEAGIFAYVVVTVFSLGLVVMIRGRERALQSAVVTSLAIIALTLLGSSLGQRNVDRAVQGADTLDDKVAMLSAGTKEASANHTIGGFFILSILGVGLGLRKSA